MRDSQACWDKLRELAREGSGDSPQAAEAIVRQFADSAGPGDLADLRHRIEDTLVAGRYTEVPCSRLDDHARWLAVLEIACVAVGGREFVAP